MMSRKLRVGVYGTWRGSVLARLFSEHEDVEITAGCDYDEKHLRGLFAARWPQAKTFTDYDEMLQHDFDILILATYCPDHGPQAVKALRAGKHVFSECQAFHTPAEGVALVEAVEETGRSYMMAENFGYLRDCMEIARMYRNGELGELVYGEAEYVHSVRHLMVKNADGSYHWRCWMPPFYYGHALAVLLEITDTRPVSVIGQSVGGKIASNPNPIDFAASLVRVDNGALIRNLLSFSAVREPSSAWYCLHCTAGSAETGRWRQDYLADVSVYKEDDRGAQYRSYMPVYANAYEQASRASHAGADFYMVLDFLEAMRSHRAMPIDVYRACDFTLPGIQAYRSSLQGGASLEVPDFRTRVVRDRYRSDHFRCERDKAVRTNQANVGGYDTYYQKIYARIFTPTFPFTPRTKKEADELTD
jgi:predicted dehydrogenase